jgi:hypothetical protein
VIDLLQEFIEILTSKLPLEGVGDGLPIRLEVEEPLGHRKEVRKVVGGKNLPLHDREVDFDLIKPTGVNRGMNQNQTRILCLQALYRTLSAMSGAVVDNPEDSSRFAVRRASHDLVDQRIKRDDTVFRFATAEDARAMDIKSGQVNPGATAPVLVLNAHWRTGSAGLRGMLARPGLDTCFFVGRDDELIVFQRLTLPVALIEIKNASRFEGEVGVAWEQPTAMLPGADSILVQPAPEGAATDAGHQTRLTDVADQIGGAPPRQRQTMRGGHFTSQRFNLHDEFWGKKSGAGPDESAPPSRRGVARRTVFATCRRLRGGYSKTRLSRRCSSPRQQAESSWRARPENTVTYICWPVAGVRPARLATSRFHKDSFWAWPATSAGTMPPNGRNCKLGYVSVFMKSTTKEAIQEFRQAMAIDPNEDDPPRALAIALMQVNELNEAETVLRDALRRLDESKRWRLHLTCSQLLTKRGDETEYSQYYNEAFKEAKKAIKLKANHADPYFEAGFIRAKLKDYKGARKYFRSCLTQDEHHDEAESNLIYVQSLIREEKERSRSSFWAGFCVGALAVSQLILLWYFFKLGKVTETILTVLLPILLGLVVVAFLIPVLYKLKLPGLEAELRERKEPVSSGLKGEIVFSGSPPTISSGPR